MVTTMELVEARVRELRDERARAGRSEHHAVRDALRWVRRHAAH